MPCYILIKYTQIYTLYAIVAVQSQHLCVVSTYVGVFLFPCIRAAAAGKPHTPRLGQACLKTVFHSSDAR